MIRAFMNMWRVPELRNKLLFTLAMLAIYRIGFMIPLPFVSTDALKEAAKQAAKEHGAFGTIADYMSIFSGGNLKQSTLFGLGIMPYISASIIFQLLGTVLPGLQALQKEGPAGHQKIMEWTRLVTVPLCMVQALMWLTYLHSSPAVSPIVQEPLNNVIFWLCGVIGLTAGSVFLMWLGEQIDKYGVGNGVSLIITAGIIDRMPYAVMQVYNDFSFQGDRKYTPLKVVALAVAFVVVVAGSIIITQGQRRIPIQQAKHTRGRRVYGGQKTYLPLRVNHGGVMPIIFASSLLIFPSMALNYMAGRWPNPFVRFLNSNLGRVEQGYLYILCYIGLIYFFAYFWTTVQFQPKEMATQLRDHGSFIPGLRPGPRTAEYLEVVMERITYVGAGCLAVIAVIPAVVHSAFKVDYQVSAFLGGTGLLIVVSVMLDFVQRIEAGLMMRNYQGFLGSGPRIRGSRGMS